MALGGLPAPGIHIEELKHNSFAVPDQSRNHHQTKDDISMEVKERFWVAINLYAHSFDELAQDRINHDKVSSFLGQQKKSIWKQCLLGSYQQMFGWIGT